MRLYMKFEILACLRLFIRSRISNLRDLRNPPFSYSLHAILVTKKMSQRDAEVKQICTKPQTNHKISDTNKYNK